MASSSEWRTNAERVLAYLRSNPKPLSAYEILAGLRAEGVTAPTTVYRALDKLLADGRVHRIASLNAWTVCCDPHHSATAVFEICDACGATTEHVDVHLTRGIAALTARTGFTPNHSVIEVHGQCGDCHAETAAS
ncbi:MAG: Fur family transcriptional regulator [Pseudomonadota bacterium]